MTELIIGRLQELDPDLFGRLHEQITEESLYHVLKPLADTHAPSQTVAQTRALALENFLRQDGFLERKNVQFHRNFENTGNSVLLLGSQPRRKQVWLLAHLDVISYFVEPGIDARYPLTPSCYHLMEPGKRKAVALSYQLEERAYRVASRGEIVSGADDDIILFIPHDGAQLRPGMRVCFDSTLEWDRTTGIVRGSLDDAAGAAALIKAAQFLADYDIEVMLGLTDEEEGMAGMGSQSICRGGLRLLHHFEQPELVIASDIHEAAEMYGGGGPDDFQLGDGASFGERATNGVGEITPPHLYELQRKMAQELNSVDIKLRENVGGYLSRTETVNAMYRTQNVAMLGFLGINRHFQRDVESAHIEDLVNLAKAVVCYSLLTITPFWEEIRS